MHTNEAKRLGIHNSQKSTKARGGKVNVPIDVKNLPDSRKKKADPLPPNPNDAVTTPKKTVVDKVKDAAKSAVKSGKKQGK